MDDLVDLNWSAPSKPATTKPQPPTANSFDFLSLSKPTSTSIAGISGSNTPNYYSSTPLRSSTPSQQPLNPRLTNTINANNGNNSIGGNGNSKPISRSSTPNLPQTAPISSGGGGLDAFSSLLSIPSSGGNLVNRNLSMAERQKALEDEKKRKDEEEKKKFEAEGHFWDNLGPSKSPQTTLPNSTTSINRQSNDLDDFLKPTVTASNGHRSKSPVQPVSNDILSPKPSSSSISGPSKPSSSAGTFWNTHNDADDFLSASSSKVGQPHKASSPAPPIDPFDFDALSASMSQPQHVNNGASGSSHTLDGDEFDILGDLAKPVSAKPRKVESEMSRSSTKTPTSRSSSPPPHIVGQIVEMGFSPIQARQALSKTDSGLDVQAALEILLNGQTSNGSSSISRMNNEEDDDDMGEDDEVFVERERQRREEEEKERRRRRRQGPFRESVKARSTDERNQEIGSTQAQAQAQAQEQAEKILAQASELGTNMFNKATTFWNTSKEKALKVYEEQRKVMEANAAAANASSSGAGGGEGRKPIKDGRPRWMTEAKDEEDQDEWKADNAHKEKGGFRDSDDEDNDRHQPQIRQKARQTNGAGSSRPNETSNSKKPNPASNGSSSNYKSSKERADLLFADEAPRYVSPSRHPKKPTTPVPTSTRPTAPSQSLPTRQLVSATPQQIEKSAGHKAKGNEHFKLGRFAEAESSYTNAISQLPEGHLFLIPLYNNRASARIKLGDSSPATEDCSLVIGLIGPSYHPSKEGPLPAEISKEVRLFDGLIKALSKRAQAWEMSEKWKNALEDWEKIIGSDLSILGSSGSSTKNLAIEGARRSRKMIEGNDENQSKSKSDTLSSSGINPSIEIGTEYKPKPRPQLKTKAAQNISIAKSADVNKSLAVSELREQAKKLEEEDDQRLALKDEIELKLNNWKNGKETNLRGLIASLNLVLWDDILKGGLKVGMHELISEKQVKIKYMKVIAKLHPDKLNSQNTTVEQRMLANGAFATLNEAWQAFNK
ncbi:uncharacterized protein L201_000283 [Kwoniella dendrophila CBS 6074]|uniref:UBA domain-containing protein n=1 Tax=Kwoniella dendrophila CBS 6074 TaxID=1295534 RepID=A0AAX4JJ30_9TREE